MWGWAFLGAASRNASEHSEHADLPQEPHLVVEQILFDDLAILPARDRAELELQQVSTDSVVP